MHKVSFAVLVFCSLVPFAVGRAQTLDGAIDMHAHAAPDGTPRKLDALDLARMAKAAGMRAIVIKNHYEPTASLAFSCARPSPDRSVRRHLARSHGRRREPGGRRVDDEGRGGYGKVVWLPTFDSESQVKLTGDKRPFAPVTRDGKVLPEVLAVIALAAKHDLVLETGHSAPQESLLIIPEAKRQRRQARARDARDGEPRRIDDARADARSREARRATRDRALAAHRRAAAKEADAIKAIGAASFVISSDLGQPPNPLHTDGLLAIYKGLMAHGISAADIDVMSRKNPARLLGLEPVTERLRRVPGIY